MITIEKAREVFDVLHPRAEAIIAEGDQHAMILLHFGWCEHHQQMEQGETLMLDLLPNKDEVAFMLNIHRITAEEEDLFVLIAESWMQTSEVKAGEVIDERKLDEEVDRAGGVKNMPGAKEAIIFQFFGKGFEYMAASIIDRSGAKPKLIKGELERPGAIMGGRFAAQPLSKGH